MTRVRLLSDLHFEFHLDGGHAFVAAQDPQGVDVLVLAGDVDVGARLVDSLGLLCRRFRDATVVYVHGNHEFYGSTREEVRTRSNRAMAHNGNLWWLDHEVHEVHDVHELVTTGGVRFLGGPMWFRHDPAAERYRSAMNDFHLIRDFDAWVYEENARGLAFLERELRPGDVVVTHYLPTRASIAPQFRGSPLNPFFLCDVEPLIRERRPRLWLHGHTHASTRHLVGETEVVCNPFGYAGQELNPEFDPGLTVEV